LAPCFGGFLNYCCHQIQNSDGKWVANKGFTAETAVKITGYAVETVKGNKQGIKYLASGGKEMAAYIFRQLLKEGYKSTLKGVGDHAIYELEKGGEKILFRQSLSGGYSGFDTFVKAIGKGKNITILFK
jgi:hypothetical protein